MIKFCSAGQTKLFSFISSIAACMGPNSRGSIPEAPISLDIDTALNTGYAQSKYIGRTSLPFALFLRCLIRFYCSGANMPYCLDNTTCSYQYSAPGPNIWAYQDRLLEL